MSRRIRETSAAFSMILHSISTGLNAFAIVSADARGSADQSLR
jgi:hypothetical protein